MAKLNLGVEIRDFDLERMGFSLSVLDSSQQRQSSEGYLRMTLPELHAFVQALKSAADDIDVRTFEPAPVQKLPKAIAPALPEVTDADIAQLPAPTRKR
jgi:hypothetical protein